MGSPEVTIGDQAQFRSVRLRAGNGSVLRRHASADNQISLGLAT